MRIMPLIVLAAALPALAQVAGPGRPPASPQPPWMEVFGKLYTAQGQTAPVGSLDREIENAWAAALAAGPVDPFFESAAQQAGQYFGSQGYHRKAENILRQAISAAGQADAVKARTLRLGLAQRLSEEQKFLAAAGLIQEVLDEVKGATDDAAVRTRISAIRQLAQLREQMGEIEAAEALLRELRTLPLPPAPQPPSSSGPQFARSGRPGFAAFRMGDFSGSYAGPSDLAGFYQRQGETAKAEALLKKEIEEANTPEETYRALQHHVSFLSSQQRWEESVAQLEKLTAMLNASSRPEDRQMLAGGRQQMAQTLAMAGRPERALEILRDNVAQSGGDAFQHAEALRSYASQLIQQKQFDEAEKVVEQIRQPSGKNAAEVSKYAQSMADQILANIRQAQNRMEEARVLRERTMAQASRPDGAPVPVWNLLQPVQEAMRRHKYDEALAQAQRILADAAPRIRSNPEEIGAFTNLIHQFPQGRQEERLQLMHALLSAMDSVVPADHPRVARALGQLADISMQVGFRAAEVTRLQERQEKILIATSGEDSPALNNVSRQRAQFYTFRGDHAEAAAELGRAVKRSEAASGPRSQPTLQIMRELTNSLQMTNDSWPEEESVRLAVIGRSGQSNGMVLHDMSTLASRYFAAGQRENAVSWMNRAIEFARKSPQAASLVPQFTQQRDHFANAQNQAQPGANPFYGAAPARWFDTSAYSTTHGTSIGSRPVPAGVGSAGGGPLPSPPPPAK